MRCLILAVLACVCAAADAPVAIHGTLHGHPFWARLGLPEARFNGNRTLELVYEPPAAETVGGAHLSDTPFLLLDPAHLIVAWNGRDRLSNATPLPAKPGYRVARELEGLADDGTGAKIPYAKELDRPGPRGWDVRVAPVLLAFAWTPAKRSVPAYDLFAAAAAPPSAIAWEGVAVDLAGTAATVESDAAGRLQRLSAGGTLLIQILGRTP